jgi:hypothetical protein
MTLLIGLAAATEAVLLAQVGGVSGRELVEGIINAARPKIGPGASSLAWITLVLLSA